MDPELYIMDRDGEEISVDNSYPNEHGEYSITIRANNLDAIRLTPAAAKVLAAALVVSADALILVREYNARVEDDALRGIGRLAHDPL